MGYAEKVEDFLYSSGIQQKGTRTTPMRVVCVGLSRSATESLKQALEILGVCPAYHGWGVLEPGAYEFWVKTFRKKYRPDASIYKGESSVTREWLDLMLGDCQAVTDFCAAHFAEDVLRAYPDALVILNTRRDQDAWYESMMATFSANRPVGLERIRNYFSPKLYWRNRYYDETIYGFYHGDMPATAKWRAREHIAAIRGSVDRAKMLEWSVEDGWQPLCSFLNIGVPSQPFPNGNQPAAYKRKALNGNLYAARQGNINFVIFCLVLMFSLAVYICKS